jgi:hypothetical protein
MVGPLNVGRPSSAQVVSGLGAEDLGQGIMTPLSGVAGRERGC